MAISLADILDEKNVVLELRARTQDEALREIIEVMKSNASIANPEQFLDQVMKRERESSTVMEGTVAFAHARTDLVQQIVLGLGRSRDGIPFPRTEIAGRKSPANKASADRVRLVFVIAVPKQLINDYLVCVGALARVVKDDVRRAALLTAGSAAEIVEQLRAGSLLVE
jgi:mannitol/fructose-specific phosphotransferase system IIA component (Ntr-type)